MMGAFTRSEIQNWRCEFYRLYFRILRNCQDFKYIIYTAFN